MPCLSPWVLSAGSLQLRSGGTAWSPEGCSVLVRTPASEQLHQRWRVGTARTLTDNDFHLLFPIQTLKPSCRERKNKWLRAGVVCSQGGVCSGHRAGLSVPGINHVPPAGLGRASCRRCSQACGYKRAKCWFDHCHYHNLLSSCEVLPASQVWGCMVSCNAKCCCMFLCRAHFGAEQQSPAKGCMQQPACS